MKTPHLFVRLLPWLAVLFPAVAASAAFTAGGAGFTSGLNAQCWRAVGQSIASAATSGARRNASNNRHRMEASTQRMAGIFATL